MSGKNLLLLFLLLSSTLSFAQGKFYTKTGTIDFYSKASLEDIEAKNKTVTAVIDSKSGAIQFAAQMKSFEFEKKLMQEHFNKTYVESDTYPKAEFKGTITNNSAIKYTTNGTYTAKVKGKLTIHGVTKDVETTGTIKVEGGKVQATSAFNILLTDYNISIPAAVKEKISNNIKITVDCAMEALKS